MSKPGAHEPVDATPLPLPLARLQEREEGDGLAAAPIHQNTTTPRQQNTFVGLGFGPIQAGLFLYEAAQSGRFARLVVGEIVPEVVTAVRAAGGYALNIAHSDHIETVEVAPVEIFNPTFADQRAALVCALAEASEAATALPSVALYDGDASAPARLIAAALELRGTQGAPLLIYTGENTLNAAHVLETAVRSYLPVDTADALLDNVAIVDTVIGKMSGYASPGEGEGALAAVAPGLERAFLVEAFNRILISRPHFTSGAVYERGIAAFHAEDDLLPFEHFKLYCHNGMHAMAAYLGKIAGCTSMAQLVRVPGLLPLVRDAVNQEAGAALVARYGAWSAEFTVESIAAKVDDLIERMVNPFLNDEITRVARDPARKLGWTDRLVGAMNFALDGGITPHRYALGAAAALADLVDPEATQTGAFPWGALPRLWGDVDSGRAAYLEDVISEAWQHLEAFRDASSATPMAPATGRVVAQTATSTESKIGVEPVVQGADGVSHSVTPHRTVQNRMEHEAPAYYASDS